MDLNGRMNTGLLEKEPATVSLNPEQLGETKLPLSELQLVLMIDMGNEKLYTAREGSAHPCCTQGLAQGA
jgi:hypothetical protein